MNTYDTRNRFLNGINIWWIIIYKIINRVHQSTLLHKSWLKIFIIGTSFRGFRNKYFLGATPHQHLLWWLITINKFNLRNERKTWKKGTNDENFESALVEQDTLVNPVYYSTYHYERIILLSQFNKKIWFFKIWQYLFFRRSPLRDRSLI